jgi:hypothetical protein
MCVEFRIFGIPFVEVISDQKMNVSFETTLVYYAWAKWVGNV